MTLAGCGNARGVSYSQCNVPHVAQWAREFTSCRELNSRYRCVRSDRSCNRLFSVCSGWFSPGVPRRVHCGDQARRARCTLSPLALLVLLKFVSSPVSFVVLVSLLSTIYASSRYRLGCLCSCLCLLCILQEASWIRLRRGEEHRSRSP